MGQGFRRLKVPAGLNLEDLDSCYPSLEDSVLCVSIAWQSELRESLFVSRLWSEYVVSGVPQRAGRYFGAAGGRAIMCLAHEPA